VILKFTAVRVSILIQKGVSPQHGSLIIWEEFLAWKPILYFKFPLPLEENRTSNIYLLQYEHKYENKKKTPKVKTKIKKGGITGQER
jgi:hypothetical protein